MKRRRVLLFTLALSFPAAAALTEYTVRSGDTLSGIAARSVKSRRNFYGQNGKLSALLQLNPQIKNPDLIYPGDKIFLSAPAGIEREVAAESVADPSAPPPALVPSSAPVAADVNRDSGKQNLEPYFALSLMYMQIDAEDRVNRTTGVFSSQLLPELRLGLRHHLDDDLNIGLSFSIRNNQWNAMGTGQTLEQPRPSTGLRAEVEKKFESGSSLWVRGGVSQKLFSRASAVDRYVFDQAQVASLGAAFDWHLLERRQFHFGVGGSVDFLQSSKVNSVAISSGTDFELSLFLKKNISSWSLTERVFYGRGDQDSDLVKQSEQRIGFTLGMGYAF